MAEFTWDVHLPGEDLPHRITTDYLLSDGETISIDSRQWLVERVEIDEAEEVPAVSGVVTVIPPVTPDFLKPGS